MLRNSRLIKKISSWYFDKKMLPNWVILLADAAIVLVASLFTYWVINRTQNTFDNRTAVLGTAVMYAVLSWVGAIVFRTFSSVLRYVNSVDLLRLAYANITSFVLAVVGSQLFKLFGVEVLCALSPLETVVVFLIATLLMWASRIVVRILFEAANSDTQGVRVLIFGALKGGIGLAKYISTQNPVQYTLAGFISHEPRIKDMKLLGVNVYTIDDDIVAVIKKENIQAVLVSPLRTEEFRENQRMQDLLIGAGVKIIMSQEAVLKEGEKPEKGGSRMELREVSVEDWPCCYY